MHDILLNILIGSVIIAPYTVNALLTASVLILTWIRRVYGELTLSLMPMFVGVNIIYANAVKCVHCREMCALP